MKTLKIVFLVAAMMSLATLENLNTWFFVSFTVMMMSGIVWSVMMDRREAGI